ncbi:MAG: O-antigen ligase family protein [Actinobacteria bacterium]|nr:O-antigen ligase family protein [Actinomycetota bacterium]MBV8395593.1 O-antigen ligase family protein [Actinomycetota bacterium]MBV8598740.1 O-antigen ligase family protein [Actinomycetota bacterium]
MSAAELARAGGVVGALGIALLVLGTARSVRLAGLGGWVVGCALLAVWLAPSGHHRAYAAAAVVGAVVAVGLGWVFVRVPWLLAVAVLACAPARIPVTVGSTTANLLLPMYVVVAGAAVALAWELFGEDRRTRELGRVAWPLALFVGWTGVTFLWTLSAGEKDGAVYLLFYVLPFALLAVSLSRLSWSLGWAGTIYAQLALMAFVFAVIGGWQYLTRNVFWNPKVIVDNAYAPNGWFYRVNSVFYDPSIYGRFLVVGILASLVVVLFVRDARAWVALGVATITWLGLVPSFSQSSFVALAAGIVVALVVLWRRRAVVPVLIAVAALGVVSFGVPQVRHRLLGKAGLSHATGGRSKLVSKGVRLALDHPLVGVGAGGFKKSYANLAGLKGKEPKAAASHDTPITVAAESGVPGLALLAWLVAAGLILTFRANAVRDGTDRVRVVLGLALVAIVVHSLFYDALLEDPLFWGALALAAVAWRAREAT